jgi:WD40 repeat protein
VNAEQARIAILALLYRQGHATRYEILALREMTAELYEPIREQFLSERLALDGAEGGLTYIGPIPFADALHVLDVLHARDLADSAWREYRAGIERLSAESRLFLPLWLTEGERWDDLETLLTDLAYLEARNAAGELADLIDDIARGVAALPGERPQQPNLKLLLEALRRDADFIARHALDYPQGLFQCLWNNGWWYDCPDAAAYYDPPSGGSPDEILPWSRQGAKLCALLERWRREREHAAPGFFWVRAQRPPATRLGEAQSAVLRGHEKDIHGLTFSPDGRRIATHSADQTLRVWDGQTGTQLAVLRGHTASVWCISYSPDGLRIASGSYDGTIRVWDAGSGAELAVYRGHADPITCVSFSPDGRWIAFADISRDANVRVWNDQSGVTPTVLRGHSECVETLAWSPDGRRVASGASDRTVRVWNVETHNVTVLRGHEAAVRCVVFSPDGHRIASGSNDGTARVWDVDKEIELAVMRGYQGAIDRVLFSPDGRRIASVSYRPSVWVWDAETYKSLKLVQETSEAQTILAEPKGIAFRALIRKTETDIVLAASGRKVAIFPVRFKYLLTASSGSDWIGAEGNSLFFLSLEGDRQFKDSTVGSHDAKGPPGKRRPDSVDFRKASARRRLATLRDISLDLFQVCLDKLLGRQPHREPMLDDETSPGQDGKRGSQKPVAPWLYRCVVAAAATGLILGLGLGVARYMRISTLQSVRHQLKEAAKADDAPKYLKNVDWDTASLGDVQIEIEPSAMRVLKITHLLWQLWYVWAAVVFCICLAFTCFWRRP